MGDVGLGSGTEYSTSKSPCSSMRSSNRASRLSMYASESSWYFSIVRGVDGGVVLLGGGD